MFKLVVLRVLESYFRHRWLYLLPIAMMTAVAMVYPSTVKPTYVASGNIYIQSETLLSTLSALQSNGFGWLTPTQATAAEMNQLFNATAFLNAVTQQTDLAPKMTGDPSRDRTLLRMVRSAIWVYPLGDNLLSIGASHEDPRVAYQLATSVISTYIQWKINLGIEGSTAAKDFFVELVESYRTELDPARRELTDYLTVHPVPLRGERPAEEIAEIARLQAIVDQVMARVRDAESKEENARLAMVQIESDVRQTYFTVDEPVLPTSPEGAFKETLLVMIMCVAAGFILSFFAIVGGALLDRTQRFPVDVRHGLGLPVLATIPEAKGQGMRVKQNSSGMAPVSATERRIGMDAEAVGLKPRKAVRTFGFNK